MQDCILNAQTASVRLLHDHLSESLKLRILNIPEPPRSDPNSNVRLAVLFSGGLDCTVLARMAHDILPPEQQIDLINVAFENPRVIKAAKNPPKQKRQSRKSTQFKNGMEAEEAPSEALDLTEISPYESCPDRETGRKAFQELKNVCPGRTWRFVAVCKVQC
jgi:asparagine synthetase B (glutamine-hydrolysing)